MSGFSNRVEDAPVPTAESLRASVDRLLEGIDRLSPMRAWGADQRVPVPEHLYELLRETEYEALERDLAEHLESTN